MIIKAVYIRQLGIQSFHKIFFCCFSMRQPLYFTQYRDSAAIFDAGCGKYFVQ